MQNVGNMGKSALRVAKNYTRGYTDVQTKVRDATSNDAWGPSGTQMSEIAQLTYNQNDFVEIMEMLDKRLNDKGKNWRHVFKSLTLLDYCLHAGSQNCILYFKENIYIIKTLKEFQYLDESGKDQGANVRQKAKDITNLLLDESRLSTQRKSRANMKDRLSNPNDPPSKSSFEQDRPSPNSSSNRPSDDMANAIEASKRSAQDDAARAKRNGQSDDDLATAMRLSRETEEKRQRDLAAANGGQLFDDDQPNNLIDMSGNNLQPMMTGMPFASYNPYAQQQQQQQEEWARQQQMADLQRQAEEMAYMQHQQSAQQQQLQQEEWARQQQYQQQLYQQSLMQQQQQQQQPLVPQPTAYGSNNPFAAFTPATPPPLPQAQPTYIPPPIIAPPPLQSQPTSRIPKDDGKNSELARLLAAGREDGLDTFGNIGSMRVPAQYNQKTGLAGQVTGNGRGNPFGFSDSFGNPRVNPTGPPPANGATSNSSPFFTI